MFPLLNTQEALLIMEQHTLKKIIFAALVGMVVVPYAFAGEEIQLAAAIGSTSSPTGSTSSGSSGSATTTDTGTTDTGTAATGMGTTSMVTIGVIAAGAIAAIAGGSSTSNH